MERMGSKQTLDFTSDYLTDLVLLQPNVIDCQNLLHPQTINILGLKTYGYLPNTKVFGTMHGELSDEETRKKFRGFLVNVSWGLWKWVFLNSILTGKKQPLIKRIIQATYFTFSLRDVKKNIILLNQENKKCHKADLSETGDKNG